MRFCANWWHVLGGVLYPAELRARSGANPNRTSDSQILCRNVILHPARDLWGQRAKCGTAWPIIFVNFGRLLGHGSGFVCSCSLGLCQARALYEPCATCKCGSTLDVPDNPLANLSWTNICGTQSGITILKDLVAHFGLKICVPAALCALPGANSNCTYGSSSLSRRVILYHARVCGVSGVRWQRCAGIIHNFW